MSTSPDPTPPLACRWCSTPLRTRRRLFCSDDCLESWKYAGGGSSAAVVRHRLAHAERQPKGCDSVEAFLAAGGSIYRE